MSVPGLGASTDAVVAWLLGAAHLDTLDADGRPIGERASRRYESAPQKEAVRRFDDSRDASGLPCNLAALAQLTGCWRGLGAAISSFERDRPATAYRALRRVEAGTALAPIVALRSGEPVRRDVSALFKATLGYGELITAMLIEAELDADSTLPGRETLFKWLDERPWLIGERQVCAGTRKQIGMLWDAIGGDAEVTGALPGWDALGPTLDALEELAALAAVAAGAARVHLAAGATGAGACLTLYEADEVPRAVSALRVAHDGGPLHPTLLFPADAVPLSVRAMIEALPAPGASAAFREIDRSLTRGAAPVAERLMSALGREASPLTRAAFIGATRTGGTEHACAHGRARPG